MNQMTENSSKIVKYISLWALFVGTVTAIGLTFLFNVLTMGLGLSLFTEKESGQIALTFGGVAWMIVGSYMALFIPGWLCGRLINNEHPLQMWVGVLHGFLTWSLYLMLSWILLAIIADDLTVRILHSFFINIGDKTIAANKMGYTGLISFFIFFIGAIGCCIGAACGMNENRRVNKLL